MDWIINKHGLTVPPGMCEICGAPANIVWFDRVDVTIRGDEEKHYLPGKRHIVCHLHRPTDKNHYGKS